ncbi:MAG: hypothetical protein HYV95_02260 [Opitutae bacterium]|nr:hypothetical protein [Opitutae bacterium]
MKRPVILFLALGFLSLLRATTIDLGQGLGYLRVHSLNADEQAVTEALGSGQALVLDLRGAIADKLNAKELRDTLALRGGKEPLFVLVGPLTPPDLTETLATAPGKPVTLGVRAAVPAPQVVVQQAPETDLRAFEALESGLPLADLISGKIEKERYDEAALMNDFRNGNTEAEPPAPADPTATAPATKPKGAEKAEKAPVLIDRVLQRAVHLHRALLALRPRG